MSPPEKSTFRLAPLSVAGGGPLYVQIVEALKREIACGRLAPGAALPSFRALAEDLLVSVITVKRAYEELEREGIIFCRQGLGTFVAEDGARRNDELNRARAAEALEAALDAAREAGLTDDEIDLLVDKDKRKHANEPRGAHGRWKAKR